MSLLKQIEQYWTDRAEGYSKVNQEELESDQRRRWRRVLQSYFPEREPGEIRVLDVGTGPGFFAIILAELGYQVTAVDYTVEMLRQAQVNAGQLRERICWRQMDAQDLDFDEGSFDVIVSRNLTWNLECPEQAYQHWHRVLKKGGLMLNFDANWYHHLFDDAKRREYELDREKVKDIGVEDHYLDTDIDAMEDIARQVPLSRYQRPAWDRQVLEKLSFSKVRILSEIWKEVWSDEEQINYGSTPMFLVAGVK